MNSPIWICVAHYAVIVVVAILVVVFIYLCLQRTRRGVVLAPTMMEPNMMRRSSIQGYKE